MRVILISIAAILVACSSGGSSSANPSPPDPALTPVYDIQGSGGASPFEGHEVIVEGVVTGDFQEGDSDTGRNLGGFYIQGSPDGDAATSDGVFVFDGMNPATDVSPGDAVRVSGSVAEFFGETQIAAAEVKIVGSGDIEPVAAGLPAGTVINSDGRPIADLERYEGMLISFPQALTVSQLRYLERYGEVLLSQGGRQYAYTNMNAPDVAGFAAHTHAVASRRIHLDDGLRVNNAGTTLQVRNGDEVSNLTGVLRYSRGAGDSGTETYRLMPTVEPVFDSANPRPAVPVVDGSFKVATLNVNNYFSTPDGDGPRCGPKGEDDCRGADSDEELARQLARIVTVLEIMDADIVAMIELENNAKASLQTIVDALNASVGAGAFAFVDTGTIGNDAIKVGLIYKPATVRAVGDFELLDRTVDVRFDDSRNRPVLAQTFETTAESERFTVLALHLKSKSSSCDSNGDPDIGDGQGNCSATRALAAAAIIDWIADDPTSSGDSDFLVIGDFNTYTFGDAMMLFANAGYVNVASKYIRPTPYSFEFDGQFGSLDHAVVTPSLAPQVAGAADWHINADEPPLNDYNLDYGRDPDIFDPAIPYRASDHDPLIVGFELSP